MVCEWFQRPLAGGEVAASVAALRSPAKPLDANSRRRGRSGRWSRSLFVAACWRRSRLLALLYLCAVRRLASASCGRALSARQRTPTPERPLLLFSEYSF